MKRYTGDRTIDGIRVEVDGAPLDARSDLAEFSSAGFEWTYKGAGPQQLALALLADHLGDDQRALALCEAFMHEVVADLENEWALDGEEIDAALARIEGRAPAV